MDNDAGGLATYSQAGAAFGYDMLWIFIPVTVALVLIQEMVNRMGVVTGEGLSSLIRARFGVKITFYLMLILLATNFGNVVAEFAGIAAASGLFGIPSWISVPICALLVWAMVVRGTYRSVEKIFLAACIFYLAYIVTAFIVGPDMGEVGMALVTPTWVPNQDYTVLVVGLIGTTIAPWMQFYQQASVVEKNIRIEEYGYSRADTIIGCILVSVVAHGHRRGLLPHPPPGRHPGQYGRRGSSGPDDIGRGPRHATVCVWPLERLHVRCLHPSALHGLQPVCEALGLGTAAWTNPTARPRSSIRFTHSASCWAHSLFWSRMSHRSESWYFRRCSTASFCL